MKVTLYCPNCGYKQICPCYKCEDIRDKTRSDLDLTPWKWTTGGGSSCSKCGFDASADFWAGLEKIIALWAYQAIVNPMKVPPKQPHMCAEEDNVSEMSLRVLNELEKQIKEITNEKTRKKD